MSVHLVLYFRSVFWIASDPSNNNIATIYKGTLGGADPVPYVHYLDAANPSSLDFDYMSNK